jgi:hypothetical protein
MQKISFEQRIVMIIEALAIAILITLVSVISFMHYLVILTALGIHRNAMRFANMNPPKATPDINKIMKSIAEKKKKESKKDDDDISYGREYHQ